MNPKSYMIYNIKNHINILFTIGVCEKMLKDIKCIHENTYYFIRDKENV